MVDIASVMVQARSAGSPVAPSDGATRSRAGSDSRTAMTDDAAPANVKMTEAQELAKADVLLADQPPGNVAFIHVQSHALANDRWAFSLLSASSVIDSTPPAEDKPRARPKLILADLAQDVNPATSLLPSRILALMREATKDNRDLVLWINELRMAVDEELHLVVADHTGFEIPWELLTLPATQSQPETYLGAAVSVTRWQDIYDDRTFESLHLHVNEERYSGRVAAFVDTQALQGGGKETKVLADIHASMDEGLSSFEDRLTRAEAGMSLIYLACHGHWAPSLLEFALGSPSVSGERLVLGLLQAKRLRLFEHSKAIVFINACHSGRMFQEHEYLDTERLRGFPELFLGKGAVGVIATTGFVNDHFATTMADWLLRALCTTEEPISALLCRWRAAVIDRLPPETSSEEEKVELLNAFMYVYYGNPLSRLRIVEGPA